jgi:hypothetical protein
MTVWEFLNAPFREVDEVMRALIESYRKLYAERIEEEMSK